MTTEAALGHDLSDARRDGAYSVERALSQRRSIREFRAVALRAEELAQLAWAAQGVVTPSGLRTAPSAGALYQYCCRRLPLGWARPLLAPSATRTSSPHSRCAATRSRFV